jgi:saccharopine dehydrogenase-like NADP-dependent oxidoreductase
MPEIQHQAILFIFTLQQSVVMKRILLFGAGKSATVLIDYLKSTVRTEGWFLTVVDANAGLAQEKVAQAANCTAASFDIQDAELRRRFVKEADLVISLLPPALHLLVAKDCLAAKKDLLTASYVDEEMKKLAQAIAENGLLFLCEMGLDPGLDHMSAKCMIDDIQEKGGEIQSFLSHCGGLVAPESDDNPWHYKISWNPRNVVRAGMSGAVYRENGIKKHLEYAELFSEKRFTTITGLEPYCWYPNRDSLSYAPVYGLEDCQTFIRTTLRHPDFMYGWKNLIDLQLTNETPQYTAGGKSLKALFKEHLDKQEFNQWLEQRLQEQFSHTKTILTELMKLTEIEQKAATKGVEPMDEFMVVDEEGDLKEIDIDDLKLNAAAALADRMHDAKLTLKQLFFLGMDDDETMITQPVCSPADILQHALEKKLALQQGDKDMVVMKHEIDYLQNGEVFKQTSTLVVKGKDNQYTAMAATVGLPLGIAAKLILKDIIQSKGLQIPVTREIYEPMLAELAAYDIRFLDEKERLA